jgi:hypothetical protein
MPDIPLLPEKGFPVQVKKTVNLLNQRTKKLEDFTADEPFRLLVADANIRLSGSEEFLRLMSVLAQLDESGVIEDLLNPNGGVGDGRVTAEYWDADSSTVKTANFVVDTGA